MTQLKGFVTHIIYRNSGNGYTVFELNTGDEITCVGTFQSLEEGEILELEGDFTEHAVYGSQFKVSSFKFSSPEDAAGMERYLGSGAIKGVGASLAARIVKRFGADTFRIIEEEPERLLQRTQARGNRRSRTAEAVSCDAEAGTQKADRAGKAG